jgi:hypothetical protein
MTVAARDAGVTRGMRRATLLSPAPIAYLKTPFGQIDPTRTAKAMNNSERACIAAGSSADIRVLPFICG